jgi:peptidyl-prolyl cis-trans isomerase C
MTQLRDYHAWSIASVRFSAPFDALTSTQREQLEQDVDRALAMEAAILASPEAASVTIPTDQQDQAVADWWASHPSCDLPECVVMDGVRREVMVQAVLDGVAARAVLPTEAEAKAFYLEDPKRFARPERRTIRHLLLSVSPDVDDAVVIKGQAEGLLTALKAGESFSALAEAYSACPTARQGGLIGTITKDSLYPAVDDVAFSLEDGAWSEPVRSNLGWHIVYCEAIHPAESPSYELVGPRILEYLADRARRMAQVDWLSGLLGQFAA